MRTPRFTTPVALAVAATLTLSACSPDIAQRGVMPDIDKVASITPSETTKQEVERALGSPSSINMFGEETWLYVGETTERIAFLERKVQERSVLIVTFDKNGVVSEVQSHGLDASRDIEPIERTTPAVGRDLTVIEQLVGNLNRLGKAAPGGGQ
jgi:outer membrane protein assembly factor BamE (lipoprotein component of BamABCDE complex)